MSGDMGFGVGPQAWRLELKSQDRPVDRRTKCVSVAVKWSHKAPRSHRSTVAMSATGDQSPIFKMTLFISVKDQLESGWFKGKLSFSPYPVIISCDDILIKK